MNNINKQMEKLLDCVIEEDELTTKILASHGFSSKHLKKMKEEGYLKSVTRGHFEFIGIRLLKEYSEILNSLGEKEKAKLYHKKYLTLTYSDFITRMFESIIRKDYDDVFKMIDETLEAGLNSKDVNYVLYLMNQISDLPLKYAAIVKDMKVEDILFEKDDDKTYFGLCNNVRILSWNKDYSGAKNVLQEAKRDRSIEEVRHQAIETLFREIQKSNKNQRYNFKLCIHEKKYTEALNYLVNKEQRYGLTLEEKYILRLLNIYKEIKMSKKIPVRNKLRNDANLYKAIDSNNFDVALSLANKNQEIYAVLSEICALVEKIEIEDRNREILLSSVNAESSTLLQIGFICLELYLEKNNKSVYEAFANELMCLTLFKKDKSLGILRDTLINIKEGIFDFDLQEYVQDFYDALNRKSFQEALIYIHLIEYGSKIGEGCVLTDGLYKILKEKQEENDFIAEFENNPNESEPYKVEESKAGMCEFIEEIRSNVLKTHEPIIVDTELFDSFRVVEFLLRDISDIRGFEILDDKSKVVFVYRDETGIEDLKTFDYLANKAYLDDDYENTVKYYLSLLKTTDGTFKQYGRLGIAYGNLEQYDKALIYLSIAEGLGRKQGKKVDYSSLISEFRSRRDKKHNF